MKRKIFIYNVALAAGLFLTSACNSKLDVDPTQSIDETDALSTSKDVEVTLIGCYDALQDVDVYGGAFQYASELLGNNDEIAFGGTFRNMLEISARQLTTQNLTAELIWRDSYVTINRCNNVLSRIGNSCSARTLGRRFMTVRPRGRLMPNSSRKPWS